MREAIVHIGTTKTGTTSVQAVLKKSRPALEAQGAFYPLSPGPSAHFMFSQEAQERHRTGRGLDAPARDDGSHGARLDLFRARFAAEMEGLPAHVSRVILSDERLSYSLDDPQRVAAFHQLLRPYFDRFTILVYLRDQTTYLASRYSNLLRLGMAGDVEELQSREAQEKYYDYDALLTRWADVFGNDAMRPRIYEGTQDKGFDTVADFLAACGLDLPKPEEGSFRWANPSISFAGQQVLERLHKIVTEGGLEIDGPKWRYLANAVRRAHPGRGWLPTKSEAEAFMMPYRDGNERVRARYFPDRRTLFHYDYSRFPDVAMAMTDAELFTAACQAMLQAIPRGERTPRGGKRAQNEAAEAAETAAKRADRKKRRSEAT